MVRALGSEDRKPVCGQFQPWYFAVAFPFCFKYGTACPNVTNTVRQQEEIPRRHDRNAEGAPGVKIHAWGARGPSPHSSVTGPSASRSGTTCSGPWSTCSRTPTSIPPLQLRISRTPKRRWTRRSQMGPRSLLVPRSLWTAISPSFATCLDWASMLRSCWATWRLDPNISPEPTRCGGQWGTQTPANRICYGISIFLTFSPSERDTTLMARLARARQTDPAIIADGSGRYQQRMEPQLWTWTSCDSRQRHWPRTVSNFKLWCFLVNTRWTS